jgi:hypothetical protein
LSCLLSLSGKLKGTASAEGLKDKTHMKIIITVRKKNFTDVAISDFFNIASAAGETRS